MAQFDVHAFAGGPNLVVDCQSDLLDHIESRFVVPLMQLEEAPPPAGRLNPVFRVGGTEYLLLTQSCGAVDRRDLGPAIATLASRSHQITNALDMLITGV